VTAEKKPGATADARLLGAGDGVLGARNFRCRSGELDLIMRERKKHDAQLVFVEVRYRNSSDFARPEETVTGAKQARIRSCAGFFLSRYRRFRKWPFRFDIVALSGAWPRREVRWIQNAF